MQDRAQRKRVEGNGLDKVLAHTLQAEQEEVLQIPSVPDRRTCGRDAIIQGMHESLEYSGAAPHP